MPASLWELVLRAFLPHRHVNDARLRDARTAKRTAEAKLAALDRFAQRINGAFRRDP